MPIMTNTPAFLSSKGFPSCTRNTSKGDTNQVDNKGSSANKTDMKTPKSKPMIIGCVEIVIATSKGKNS